MNGEFLSKRLKTQTAPRFKKNCNPDCHTNPVGTVTCRAMGPATPPGLFFLQSASSRPSNAHVYWISASIGATRASSRYLAEPSKYAACSVILSPAARVWASVLLGCQTNTELAASLWGDANCGRRASTPSVPDWQNLIKADCAVPGSRRNRRGISSRTPPSYCSRFAYLPSVA